MMTRTKKTKRMRVRKMKSQRSLENRTNSRECLAHLVEVAGIVPARTNAF